MPMRKNVLSLRSLCLNYVSSHIDIWWENNYHSCRRNCLKDNSVACLPKSILDEIINYPKYSKHLRPQHLDMVIHQYTNRLNFTGQSTYNAQSGIDLIRDICVNLQYLNLSDCKVSTRNLRDLAKSIPSIISLRLKSTPVTDEVLATLGRNCPNLRDLDVTSTSVTNLGVVALCATTVDASGHKLSGCCKLIHVLRVGHTAVNDDGALILIPNLPYLRHFEYRNSLRVVEKSYKQRLEIANHQFALENIFHCKSPTTSITNYTINIATVLCQNVTDVTLYGVDSTDKWIPELAKFPQLKKLSITSCSEKRIDFNESVLPLLRLVGSNMKSLHLNSVLGVDLFQIGIYCTQLLRLKLSFVDGYNSFLSLGMTIPPSIFANLREVTISCMHGSFIPSDQLETLLTNCHLVQTLYFQRCQYLTDDMLARVFERNELSRLISFAIEVCHNINISSIVSLINKCNSLRRVYCWNCARIQEFNYENYDVLREKTIFVCR